MASRWNRPGTANAVEFRSLLPFKVWEQENLLRISLPFRTQSELGSGLSDARLFDLLIFDVGADGSRSGFWGVGPVFNLGVNKGPGVDTFQVGPALALILTSIRSLSIGLLNQNFFSSQVAASTLQPILAYQATRTWSFSLGELPLVYDWKTNQFAVVSFGLQIGALFDIAKQPIRFFVNPQFNTKSNAQLYHWTIATGVTLPVAAITP